MYMQVSNTGYIFLLILESRGFYLYQDWSLEVNALNSSSSTSIRIPDTKEFSTTTITKLFYRFMKFSLKSLYEVSSNGLVETALPDTTILLPEPITSGIPQAHVERIRQTFFESMNALLDGFEWLAVHWRDHYEIRNGLVASLSPVENADLVPDEGDTWWGDDGTRARPTTTLRANANIDTRGIVSGACPGFSNNIR
jgi:hypothetical protein